jgi:dihydroorotate dehydrogenase
MSGAPVHKKNLELVRYIHKKSEGRLPIIGVGGIMSGEEAKAMMDAGASLVEIYSGFIYEGPGLIKKILTHLENCIK